jgi:O-antigen/teichoic acid export membrane protein
VSDEHHHDGMVGRILSGLAWKAGSQVMLQITRLVVALFLARMLAPDDWGVAAMVLVFSGFVIVFTDNALGTALIQRRTIDEDDRSTVFWSSAGIGVLLALGGWALSGPLASFYGEPEVQPLFVVLSLSFFVATLGTTQSALLVRDMQFRILELRQMAATVVGAAAGIAVAIAGGGAWAIVIQQLADATTSTILLWILTPWRPKFRFSTASLRRLGGFAGNVFGENLLYQAGRNIANLLIGRFIGAAALGAYSLATNVILVPFSRIAAPLQQVFFPAFSRMDDKERMADMWVRVMRLVGAISIPALVGLAIVAPEFVDVVLGDKWHAAIPVIQILAWAGLVQSLQTLNGEILLALGKASWLLGFTALWFVGSLTSFLVGVHWGIIGVAVAYAVVTTVIEPIRAYLACRALGFPLWRFVAAFGGVAQATAIMAAVVLAARQALVAEDVPQAVTLVLLIVLGAAVYTPCCLWRAPEIRELMKGLAARRRRAAAPVEPRLSEL